MGVGTELFKEANMKLKESLKTKNFKQIAIAQAMLDAAETHIQQACTKLQKTRTEQRIVEKRKQSAMDRFLTKKVKTSSAATSSAANSSAASAGIQMWEGL